MIFSHGGLNVHIYVDVYPPVNSFIYTIQIPSIQYHFTVIQFPIVISGNYVYINLQVSSNFIA